MEIKGITHLKRAMGSLYNVYYTNKKYNPTHTSNIYSNMLCPSKISGRLVIPVLFNSFFGVDMCNLYRQKEEDIPKYIIPIIPDDRFLALKRTADPIFGFLFTQRDHHNVTVLGVKTSTGGRYYGHKGCVFDRNMTPLVIFGTEFDFETKGKLNDYPVCVINPIVFQRDDIVSKYIVKKLIPYLSEAEIWLSGNGKTDRVKVIISNDINKFIEKPAKPTPNLDSDLWKCAEENIDEILGYDICDI